MSLKSDRGGRGGELFEVLKVRRVESCEVEEVRPLSKAPARTALALALAHSPLSRKCTPRMNYNLQVPDSIDCMHCTHIR